MTFDAYHEWLGIPPDEQPPTHYRLLGLRDLETSSNAIENAADQRMAHLRNLQNGPRSTESQRLLNEVSQARLCLLNPKAKEAYDATIEIESSVDPTPVVTANQPPTRSPDGRRAHRKKRTSIAVLQVVLGGMAGLFIATLVLRFGFGVMIFGRQGERPQPDKVANLPDNGKGGITVSREKGIGRRTRGKSDTKMPSAGRDANKEPKKESKQTGDLAKENVKKSKATPGAPQPVRGTKAGDVREFTDLKIKFCWCPRGTFKMGSKGSQIDVTLSHGLWLGQTEVTQEQWKTVMQNSPWSAIEGIKEGPHFPAVMLNWQDASAFCSKLSEREARAGRLPNGWKYDLPTEAQWEHACRAGTQTLYSFGDDVRRLSEYAWTRVNARDVGEPYPHMVRSKRPNPWNLFGMHGNAWEWCRDWHSSKLPGGTDPEAVLPGSTRVIRGGGWFDNAQSSESAHRVGYAPGTPNSNISFRVARIPIPANANGTN